MTEQIAFILKAKTRPEMADAFENLFRPYVEPSRQEPGCIEYHMLRDQQDPSLFVFFEVWADQAALDVHSALPHMAAFFEKRMDYLERVSISSGSTCSAHPALTVDQQVAAQCGQADEETTLEQQRADALTQPLPGQHAEQGWRQHQQ